MTLLDFGLDIQKALAAPRLCFIEPDIIAMDEGIPASVRQELTALGHKVEVRKTGNAHALTIEYSLSGRPVRFSGGADPRGEGAAIGY